jgi:hypothetical protein
LEIARDFHQDAFNLGIARREQVESNDQKNHLTSLRTRRVERTSSGSITK